MKLEQKLRIPKPFELIKLTYGGNHELSKKTPLEKWCYLYGIGRMFISPIGYTIFEDDQTLHWKSKTTPIICIAYVLLSVHTAFHYIKQGEFVKCLPCTCLLAILLSMIPIIIIWNSKKRYDLNELMGFEGNFVYPEDVENVELYRIYLKQIDSTIKFFFTKIHMMLLAFIVAEIGPEYGLIVEGIKTTTTELKFPFIAEQSTTEYIMNVIVQCIIGAIGVTTFVGTEIVMNLIDDCATISPKLVKFKLQKLSKKIGNKYLTEKQLKITFRDILKLTLRSDDYLICVRDLLFYRTLLTPPLFTYSISMAIYCQYTMNFLAGYGIAFISWVQLFFFCGLGEHIENNGFDAMIYDFDWYNLPNKYQKDIMFLIQRKQNEPRISAGPFGDINCLLFSVITRKIYSLVMFLLNFQT